MEVLKGYDNKADSMFVALLRLPGWPQKVDEKVKRSAIVKTQSLASLQVCGHGSCPHEPIVESSVCKRL